MQGLWKIWLMYDQITIELNTLIIVWRGHERGASERYHLANVNSENFRTEQQGI